MNADGSNQERLSERLEQRLEQWLADRQAGNPATNELDPQLVEALTALDAWKITPSPALSQRVLEGVRARVAVSTSGPRLVTAPAGESRRKDRFPSEPLVLRMGNWRDALAIAAVIVFAVGVGVPGMLNMKARNQRIGCSQNLAMLGQGIQQYTHTYASSLPFVGMRPAQNVSRAEPAFANRRHMYPLLETAFVADPRLFICPSGRDIPLRTADVKRNRDFPDARNISYAYFNMAGARPSANAPASLPILSDDNPLFADGELLQDVRRYLSGEGVLSNSFAHRGVGQNVLSLDGHVQFARTPLAGLNQDNIWTLQNISEYTGVEGPADANDAQLIK